MTYSDGTTGTTDTTDTTDNAWSLTDRRTGLGLAFGAVAPVSPADSDATMWAARRQGATVIELADRRQVTRQAVYDALARVDAALAAAKRVTVTWSSSQLVTVLHLLEVLPAGDRLAVQPWSHYLQGRVEEAAEGGWKAQAGSGSTLRTLRGRHATAEAAIEAVLWELQARRARLADDLADVEDLAVLARAVRMGLASTADGV